MEVTIEETKLYVLIKQAVSEAIKENLKILKMEMIPYADDEDMEEIEKIFGSPKKYKKQKFIKQDL